MTRRTWPSTTTGRRLNSPLAAARSRRSPTLTLMWSPRDLRDNQEAFEWLEVAHTDEEYMAELRRIYPELVTEERWRLKVYKKGLADEDEIMSSGERGEKVIELSSNDADCGSSPCGVNWEIIEAEIEAEENK